jgi:hypothetical protein
MLDGTLRRIRSRVRGEGHLPGAGESSSQPCLCKICAVELSRYTYGCKCGGGFVRAGFAEKVRSRNSSFSFQSVGRDEGRDWKQSRNMTGYIRLVTGLPSRFPPRRIHAISACVGRASSPSHSANQIRHRSICSGRNEASPST